MSHCPMTRKMCIDDLCRGGNNCINGGGELLERCFGCGELTSIDENYCKCPLDFGGDDDDEYR